MQSSHYGIMCLVVQRFSTFYQPFIGNTWHFNSEILQSIIPTDILLVHKTSLYKEVHLLNNDKETTDSNSFVLVSIQAFTFHFIKQLFVITNDQHWHQTLWTNVLRWKLFLLLEYTVHNTVNIFWWLCMYRNWEVCYPLFCIWIQFLGQCSCLRLITNGKWMLKWEFLINMKDHSSHVMCDWYLQ